MTNPSPVLPAGITALLEQMKARYVHARSQHLNLWGTDLGAFWEGVESEVKVWADKLEAIYKGLPVAPAGGNEGRTPESTGTSASLPSERRQP